MPPATVPTINIAPLFGEDMEAKMQVAKQIDQASRGSGFFLVSHHGVDVLDELFRITKQFHTDLTDEEKWKLAIVAYNKDNVKQVRNGYYLPIKGKKAVESLCYLNPSFNNDHPMIKANTPMHEVNVWPDEDKHPGFKEFQEAYYWAAFHLSSILLRGFALALGKDERFFDDYFKKEDTLSSVRLIRYPYMEDYPPVKTAADGTKISFDSHEDASLLTVLYQPHVANLQVETPEGYCDIPSSDDCYLVNAGGYMAHITNNYYKAPVHRVKFVNAERLSLPFFLMLGYNSKIEPFTPHDPSAPPAKPAITYGHYFEKAMVDLVHKNGQT
uniref:Fe2OG dioxygenase domain-containing protein n=1 Tax=Plectus sambesii TaxID=2011161 RepID=A0A914VNI2_9BILA